MSIIANFLEGLSTRGEFEASRAKVAKTTAARSLSRRKHNLNRRYNKSMRKLSAYNPWK